MRDEQYHVEVDRRKAIFYAVQMAQPGDVVLLAGKGHENYQDVNGTKHHLTIMKWRRKQYKKNKHKNLIME